MRIADFQFGPAAITVHVGDTLSWTNGGPSPHTATARDGSFDTGLLKTGQSATHTFTQPGTFAYLCTIHPFMHGTVVVLARTSPPAASTSPVRPGGSQTGPSRLPLSRPAAVSGSPPAAHAQVNLPLTGSDLRLALLLGLLLTVAGISLRRFFG